MGKFYYIGLVVLALIFIWYSYHKTKNKLVIASFFAFAGVSHFFDLFAFLYGKAYIYKPGILRIPFDSGVGGIISNALSIPSAGVLIAVFQFEWPIVAGFSTFFYGVESHFANIGIFEVKWWKSIYTLAACFIYFSILKVWYKRLNSLHSRLLSFLTLACIILSVRVPIVYFFQVVTESRTFSVRWLERIGSHSFTINGLLHVIIGLFLAALVSLRLNKVWTASSVVVLIVLDLVLRKMNIVHIKTPWDNILLVLNSIITVAAAMYFGNLLEKNTKKPIKSSDDERPKVKANE